MKKGMKNWVALATILLVMFGVMDRGAAQAGVIFVTTLEQKISSSGGCSLQEAIYSANRDESSAIDSSGQVIPTPQCVAGNGDDRIILPDMSVFQMSQIVNEAENPFGPTATPMVTTNITIEARGSRLEHVGNLNFRAFAVASTGNLTVRDAYIKGFQAKGGDGAEGGGGGMGAGGAIYVKGSGSLTVENSTFEGNGATGGNGAALGGRVEGGGGGGLGGNGGHTGSGSTLNGGGGGGGSRGNGGNGSTNGNCGGSGCEGGGGGGGGTVSSGQSAITGPGSYGPGGFDCGGDGGHSGTLLGGDDGKGASCPGGGGGGGASMREGVPTSGNGGSGAYGGGGGGGGAEGGDGGNGGFGGGGGGGSSEEGLFGPNGGNGGFGGGGGAASGGAVSGGPGHGGIFGGDASQDNGGGGAGLGGAIFTEGGNVVVKNSTFTANFAVRGVAGGEGAHNGSDAGGAIFSLNGSTTVLNSTISGNEDTGSGGGIVILQFPPFPPTSLTLHNTIVANNGAQECAIAGLNPTVAASGNLIQNNVNCPGVVTSDDPQLGPLQLNSPGFTPTMAIPSTSPAFNTADGTTSLLTDQRGLKRPQGTGFDIGAFEKCTSRFEFQCLQFVIKETDTEPLITQASPPAGGTVSPPSGDYDLNSVQHLVATPNPGYFFINWTGNVSDPNSPSSYVTMDQAQTVTANFATFKPDLIISALSSNATAITPGKTFLLSNTVSNQASGSAGSSIAAFHLSTNTTYGDGDDIPFTLTRAVGPLAAGASSSASNTLIVPATAPQGTYYICVMADSGNTVTETNESNNTLCTAGTIQITQPDLIMTDVAPNALTVNQGGTLSVDDTVLNQGSVPTPIGFRVGFHLSGNNIFGDSDDVTIITNRVVAALGAGASSAGTTGLLIPSTTPPGVYFVCAMADSLAQVAEADETNNTRCSSIQVTVPLPDLIISALSTTTTTANAGGVAMVTNAIKNQGGSKAGTFVEAFHLSTNAVYGDGDDIVLTPTRTIGSLGIGATNTATNAVQIPDSTPGGSYYICANSDDGDSVAESDYTNNSRCTVTTVTVPLPDLVMKSLFKTAGTVAVGGSFAVTDIVKNQGGSSASSFAIGFVLSINNIIGDGDDILLTPQRSVGGLGVGLSSSASTTVTVPGGTTPGINYYIGAIADVNEAVAESNEGNNTILATGTITVTP